LSITSIYEAGVVINSVEDVDTLDDILDYVVQHVDAWGNSQVIWDMNLFNFQSICADSIHSFVSRAKPLSEKRPGIKNAIIVDSDLGFGMMRMLGMLSENNLKITINVFRSKDQALQWLNDE